MTDDQASPIRETCVALDRRIGPVGAVLLSLCALLAIELALQARHYFRTGEVSIQELVEEPRFVVDAHTGLRLFRPSTRLAIKGGIRADTNSWGLRGDEVQVHSKPGTRRIGFLGASTVFGMYARSNRDSPPALLEQMLNSVAPAKFEVINAGVPALTSADQLTLLEKRLLEAELSHLVWYVGQNDVACPRGSAAPPWPDFRWSVTYQLAEKNIGAWLTDERDHVRSRPPGPIVDYQKIETNLRRGVQAAKEAGFQVILVTNATLYDKALSPELNRQYSDAARRSKPCMHVDSLIAAKETLNDTIRRVAAEERVDLIDAAKHLSGRPAYFGDGTHLTVEGGRAFARLVADRLSPHDTP